MFWLSQVHAKRGDFEMLEEVGCKEGDFCVIDKGKGRDEKRCLGGEVFVYPLKVIYNDVTQSYKANLVVVSEVQPTCVVWFEAKGSNKELAERWQGDTQKGGGWYRLNKRLVEGVGAWVFDVDGMEGASCETLTRLTSELLGCLGHGTGFFLRPIERVLQRYRKKEQRRSLAKPS